MNITRQDNHLVVTTGFYEVTWDLSRGGTLVFLREAVGDKVIVDARGGGPSPDVVVSCSAALEDEPREVRLSGMGPAEAEVFQNADGRGARIVFSAAGEGIRIERTLTLRADSAWIEERVALQNIGARDVLIDRYPDWKAGGESAVAGDLYDWRVNPGGVDYLLDGLRVGGDWENSEYVMPACGYPFFHNHGRFSEMGETAMSIVAGHHGAVLPCVMAWNEVQRSGILLSCLHDRCLRYVRVRGDAATQTGSVAAQVWWARWLSPREKQEVAVFHLVPFQGDYGPVLDEYRHWLADAHNIVPPADAQTESAAAKLDELFVAYFHNIVMNGLGDMKDLAPYVDVAAEVGCTAVWAGGEWLDNADVVDGSVLSRCQPQTREGRYAVTHRYGGAESRRAMVDHMHSRGLKHVVWITGYGLSSFDPIYKSNPEAFVRMRRPVDVAAESPSWPGYDFRLGREDAWVYPPFGGPTVGSDTTNPVWRQFWLHNQDYWSAHGVDGVFFDSFSPMPPNYALRPWPGQISLEIINLQREARRKARANNPDFFTFTEGGGYLMASVNDFTHTWHDATPPPLPPFRTQRLSPAEEARFLRDEELSLLPGARSWAFIEDFDSVSRPRVMHALFSGKMPVLGMFKAGANTEEIKNETDFWAYWKPYPADAPHPMEAAHWKRVAGYWQLRLDHPELKSGTLDTLAVEACDPAVHAFLRRKNDDVTVVAINFREEEVGCKLLIDLGAAGIAREARLSPRDLLQDVNYPECSGAELESGYEVRIPGRGAAVLKVAG